MGHVQLKYPVYTIKNRRSSSMVQWWCWPGPVGNPPSYVKWNPFTKINLFVYNRNLFFLYYTLTFFFITDVGNNIDSVWCQLCRACCLVTSIHAFSFVTQFFTFDFLPCRYAMKKNEICDLNDTFLSYINILIHDFVSRSPLNRL